MPGSHQHALAAPGVITDHQQRPSHIGALPHPPQQSKHPPTCPPRDDPANHPQAQLPEYYVAIKLPIAIDTIEVRPSRDMAHVTATLRQPWPASTRIRPVCKHED